ncbi:hypothetical protein JCM3770_001347 [Rhodotorula araucariae]
MAAAIRAPAPAHTLYSASAPPAMNRPRTVLPPLASLSLPGSPSTAEPPSPSGSRAPPSPPPSLHHPRPMYPRPTSPPPLVPPAESRAPAPAPVSAGSDLYARAYSLLRERLAGCGDDVVRSAAAHARGAIEARRRSLEELESAEEEGAEWATEWPAKKRRRVRATDDGHSVDFYDNPPPRPRACPGPPAGGVLCPSMARKRSLSLPPASAPAPAQVSSRRTGTVPSPPPLAPHNHTHLHAHEHAHAPAQVPPPLASSRSLPSLAASNSASGSSRAEALRGVVRSFEAVRAVRAEGWARLARVGAGAGAGWRDGGEGQGYWAEHD